MPTCSYAYSSFAHPASYGLSPCQLTYGTLPTVLLEIETNTQGDMYRSSKECYELLRKKIAYFQK